MRPSCVTAAAALLLESVSHALRPHRSCAPAPHAAPNSTQKSPSAERQPPPAGDPGSSRS
eukprot:3113650-Prymnesium_polylepis.3